jgi:hypothetical protein
VNPGHYVLWVDRSYRMRIHEMAREYEVDDIRTGPIQNCEICAKIEHGIPSETPGPEAVYQKQVRSDEPKHERRERHEHRLGKGTRSEVRSTNRLR